MSLLNEQTSLRCIGCKAEMPRVSLVGGRPTWFGDFNNDKLIAFVCASCYEKGIFTPLQQSARDKEMEPSEKKEGK